MMPNDLPRVKKEEYAGGGVRDSEDGKGCYDLIDPHFLKRLALRLQDGAKIYSRNNWRAGIPSSRCVSSMMRHLDQFRAGEKSEDHLAAIAFGVMVLMYNESFNQEFHDLTLHPMYERTEDTEKEDPRGYSNPPDRPKLPFNVNISKE